MAQAVELPAFFTVLSISLLTVVVVVKTKTAQLPHSQVALVVVVVAVELEPAEMLAVHPLWLAEVVLVAHRLVFPLALVQPEAWLTTRTLDSLAQF
jgi:hypothetical protein